MSDLISRQSAIDAIETMQIPIMRSTFAEKQFVFKGMSDALNAIKELPSAEPQERTGYWIYDGFDHPHGIEWCHCSVCGNCEDMKSVYTNVHVYPYCAKCGARMEVDNE